MSRRHGIGGLVLIAKAQPVEVLPFEIYTRLWSSALQPLRNLNLVSTPSCLVTLAWSSLPISW